MGFSNRNKLVGSVVLAIAFGLSYTISPIGTFMYAFAILLVIVAANEYGPNGRKAVIGTIGSGLVIVASAVVPEGANELVARWDISTQFASSLSVVVILCLLAISIWWIDAEYEKYGSKTLSNSLLHGFKISSNLSR